MKKKRKREGRKGVSPVVASVLLVVVVVILASIIFIWARSFIKEAIKKNDLTADQACSEIQFDASLVVSGNQAIIDVVNKGNVALYQFNIKKIGAGRSDVEHVPLKGGTGLNGGEGDSFSVNATYPNGATSANYKEMLLIPEILGSAQKSKKVYTCPEKYGLNLEVS